MKIEVCVVDLRDDSKETFSLEPWETIHQAKLRMKARKGVSEAEQHYYLDAELLSDGLPIEQLRSHAIRRGKLPQVTEGETRKPTTVKMYIGTNPVDFADMLLADVIEKLRSPDEIKKTVKIRIHTAGKETLHFQVNAVTITVEELKAELVRALGPPSFTGVNTHNLLLYPRDTQPGRPLQGEEIRGLFGPRSQLEIEAYLLRPPLKIICKVLKWGIILKERFEIEIEDHLLLGDLKRVLFEKLTTSENPQIRQRYLLDNLVFKLNKTSITAKTSNALRHKYGVEANELWLRVFNIKSGSQIVITF